MAFTPVTSKQLAAQAGRGNLRALETLLREISDHIDELSAVEIAFLDGVTAGTGLASKALVLDSAGLLQLPYDAHIELPRAARFEIFDDFLAAALDATDNWIVFAGGDANATAATTVTAPEGKVDMGSGNAGDTTDGSVLSLILLAKGSLVSLGQTVFECRVSLDDLTGNVCWFGLADVLANTTNEDLPHTVKAGTIADGGLTVTDVAGWCFDSEATAPTKWQYTSEKAGTIGNAGAEEADALGPTADTYDVLRIEIDANGDTRWYLNGALRKTALTAVATTALLIPFIGIDGEDGTPVDTVLSLDYIYFAGTRPAAQ